jgi:hypothetical protein
LLASGICFGAAIASFAIFWVGGTGALGNIIAPDPAQSTFNFQIDLRALKTPRLVTWAAGTSDIEAVARAAGRQDLEMATGPGRRAARCSASSALPPSTPCAASPCSASC